MFFVSLKAVAGITDLRSNGPLETRPQNPLYLMFLTLPMENPQTLNRKQFEFKTSTTFSNLFEIDNTGTTTYNLDMEIWRTVLSFSYGISDQLDVRVELPFLSNSGGFLDGFVQSYHNALGVPNGGRENVANNQFAYTLSQGGTTLVNYSSTGVGLSDMIVRFKYLLSDKIHLPFKLAVAPTFKLPTGKGSSGLSSKHFDFGLSLLGEKSLKRFHFATQAGYVFFGKQTELSPVLNSGFATFGQSVEFQITDGLSVIAQLSGNTSIFKNVDAADLKKMALDLNVGFAGNFPVKHGVVDEFFYQWSFGEDILAVGPSVDFSVLFLAGIRY